MFEENEVAMARWVHEAASGTGAAARRDVTMFAQRHGMGEATAHEVGLAVCEAVPYAADNGATLRSRVVVEAATDGNWLSVRIDGDANRSGGDADVVLDLPLMCELADRFEYGTRWPGSGTSVLMEFAMTGGRAGGATPAPEDPHFARPAVAMRCGQGGGARVRQSSTGHRARRRDQSTTACS
jgi:hypothetical protein